ncbi:MAG: hypothetical protein A3D31_13550 [Candidatus Fluviicola riflensis]|nr:MAG: hypothetical protein CHH17_17985 [Candidatus Fluviicola riflensis]OGS78003.1 MAG: hypothetical protein A3D31_13550 [Candidatus Fluviicola riflensis]OGS85068.1 MAG: hypothetical protein A2724_10485 [Fluviicola sp. RIFCSPHIGHO2_01_FULL_43_53]OGS89340.1 MAG: hypothetical protein A3E30_04790 [Fluviicola sp. RIFCSPHIGHO2_12_FULL_43_24]
MELISVFFIRFENEKGEQFVGNKTHHPRWWMNITNLCKTKKTTGPLNDRWFFHVYTTKKL